MKHLISYILGSYALAVTAIWTARGLKRLGSVIAHSPAVKHILSHPLCERYI